LAHFELNASDLALVGFSQGTMMSLYVGPRREKPLAGIVGFSGAMLGPELLANDIKSTPPVTLIHGNADEVVPAQAMDWAAEALQTNGVSVETMLRPGLGHSIDEAGLTKCVEFLQKQLA